MGSGVGRGQHQRLGIQRAQLLTRYCAPQSGLSLCAACVPALVRFTRPTTAGLIYTCTSSSAENVGGQIYSSGKKIAKSSQQIVPKMSANMQFMAGQSPPKFSSTFVYQRAAQEAAVSVHY